MSNTPPLDSDDELDEILQAHYFATCHPALSQTKIIEARLEAKAKINALATRKAVQAAPKPKLVADGTTTSKTEIAVRMGFNKAVTEYTDNIRQAFGQEGGKG